MGYSIEIKTGNFYEIKNELINKCKIKDENTLNKILIEFGEKIGDTYILLNNEYYEEYNSFYNVSIFIDRHFHVDSFDIFLNNMEEANANVGLWDASEELGIELPDNEE